MRKLLFLFVLALIPATAVAQFGKIARDELEMKDNALSPGDHAMILEKQVWSEDTREHLWDKYYYRIKIFTEEGRRRYSDIEIIYNKRYFRVGDVRARTIRPDGTVADFNGEVFDTVVAKGRRMKYLAKKFTLPDVQVGSIIEYGYTVRRDVLVANRWRLQEPLFIKKASYKIRYYPRQYHFYWLTLGLPADQQPKNVNGVVKLEMANVPAFREEELMPPADELKMRVEYYYGDEKLITDPDQFWANAAHEKMKKVEGFMDGSGSLAQAAGQITAGAPDDEARLRAIYAAVQKLRNLTYEKDRSEQEMKLENLQENKNVGDAWNRKYGDRVDITRLFVALARAAGFEANVLWIAKRDETFFNKGLLDADQLNGEIAYAKAGGREYFLDPGTRQCPFGLLSWERTGVHGMKLARNGSAFIVTPRPGSEQAVTERKGVLKLDADGALEGTVTISFRGQEALQLRLEAREQDSTGKAKLLEDRIKSWLPGTAVIELAKVEGWDGTEEPLVVETKITVPGMAVPTGKRLLLSKGLFQMNERNPFREERRVHPVYYEYPYQENDEITITVPAGLKVESTAAPRRIESDFGTYQSFAQRRGEGIWMGRRLQIDGIFFRTEYYPELRSFYDVVRTGDEDHLILQYATTAAN